MPRQPKTDQQRLPRKSRAKKPPAFHLTPRDVEIIETILQYRFLYIEQVAWLIPGNLKVIELRLRLLYHHGYLDRLKQPVTTKLNKMIYSLSEKGAQLLAEAKGIGRDEITWTRFHNQVTPGHVAHFLEINNLMIAYEVALARTMERGSIEAFRIDRGEPKRNRISVELRDDRGARTREAVVPDVVLKVVFPGNQHGLFFVEVDRGTMTSQRWADKVSVYREYMHSPMLVERFKTNWFIVLTVTPSEKRIQTLAKATVARGGRRGFMFATAEAIQPANVLEQIWV